MRLPSARGGACAPPAATSLRLTRMGSCRSGGETHWFVSLTLSTLLGLAVTAYLVRSVNFKLFFAAQPVTQADRARLLGIWYRANILRLLTPGGAWLIAARLASRLHRDVKRH